MVEISLRKEKRAQRKGNRIKRSANEQGQKFKEEGLLLVRGACLSKPTPSTLSSPEELVSRLREEVNGRPTRKGKATLLEKIGQSLRWKEPGGNLQVESRSTSNTKGKKKSNVRENEKESINFVSGKERSDRRGGEGAKDRWGNPSLLSSSRISNQEKK